MIVVRTIAELRAHVNEYATAGKTIGFVPTMGYLHEGHASLLRRAREENDMAVLSLFVNPLQFGPNEDFERYPRDEARDLAVAAECGVDIAFLPTVEEMYPTKPATTVIVGGLTERLCGASRPGHFDGVGLVVSKLFHLLKPTRAYFGLKDAQQVAVIAQIVSDLNMDVQIVPCETVREPDGLALSSRNVYLSALERGQAVALSQSLSLAEQWVRQEEDLTVEETLGRIRARLEQEPDAAVDYVELLRFPSLQPPDDKLPLKDIDGTFIVALAVKFGKTRLIDNRLFERNGGGK